MTRYIVQVFEGLVDGKPSWRKFSFQRFGSADEAGRAAEKLREAYPRRKFRILRRAR